MPRRAASSEEVIDAAIPLRWLAMKLLACVLFAIMIGCSAAMAAVEQCRFINSKPDREACYERQEKALAAKRKPDVVDRAKTAVPDEIAIENQRLGNSLRNICRGC
jgi:hypothetical protein